MNKQIKSRQRVKEKGEVFTNEREVKAMCDLIPLEIWEDIEKITKVVKVLYRNFKKMTDL